MTLTYDADKAKLSGGQDVIFWNRQTAPLNEIYFRLFANYPQSGGQLVVLAVTGGLQLLDPEAADIEASAAMLRQTGPASFVTESPPRSITRAVASRVQFTLDESGQALSFTMDDGAYRYRRVR